MTIKEVKKISKEYGLECISTQDHIGLVSFRAETKDGPARINVYTTKMTVGTCLDHPKKGKTQLFRKHVTEDQLRKIFSNPRIHTGKGYYKKSDDKPLFRGEW